MSSLKVNVEFPRIIMKIEKNGIFPQEDKIDLGQKRKKVNRPKEEYIRDARAEGAKKRERHAQKIQHLEQFRHFFLFLLSSFDSIRFSVLGFRTRNRLTALATKAYLL